MNRQEYQRLTQETPILTGMVAGCVSGVLIGLFGNTSESAGSLMAFAIAGASAATAYFCIMRGAPRVSPDADRDDLLHSQRVTKETFFKRRDDR